MKQVLFFFSDTLVGGAETNILKIAKELHSTGYTIHFASLENNGPLLKKVDFPLASYTVIGLFNKTPLASYRQYKQLVQQQQLEVVLNFGLRVEIFSRIFSKRLGIKRVISNIRSTDDWRKSHHVWLDKVTAGTVDLWVANSIAGKMAFHKREAIPLDKIDVIYNFVDLQIKDSEPSAFTDPIRIGILANITKEKGYFDLLPLSRELSAHNISHVFQIGGIDKLAGDFHRQVDEWSLTDKFIFKGYVTDKSSFFEETDIFLLPSYLEGMPTVLLEAMAYNKPVVATNVGGIPELVIDGQNGFIYKPGDISGFAAGIIKLLPIEERSSVVSNARETIRSTFAKDASMKKWQQVIA